MLRSEAGIELIIEDDVRPEKQKRKPGVSDLRALTAWAAGLESQPRGQGTCEVPYRGSALFREPWPLPWVLLNFD